MGDQIGVHSHWPHDLIYQRSRLCELLHAKAVLPNCEWTPIDAQHRDCSGRAVSGAPLKMALIYEQPLYKY